MAISRLRNIGLSLFYEIESLFSLHVDKEKLTTEDYQVYHFSHSPVLTSKSVYIYENNTEINTGYSINYPSGYLTFNSQRLSTDVVEATYDYCYIKVFNGYPDDIEQNIVVPSICIEYDESFTKPIELGSKKRKKYNHEFEIVIYASGSGQRDDISFEIIENLLSKSMPLVDYSLGFPINADGTKNNSFNKDNQTVGWLEFENINLQSFRSVDFGEVSLYVMLISFTVEDYLI